MTDDLIFDFCELPNYLLISVNCHFWLVCTISLYSLQMELNLAQSVA